MTRKLLLSAIAATFALTACGGGGGSDVAGGDNGGNNGGGNPPPAQAYRVTGPLDAVQQPLSDQVFGQLISATAGTPLAPVLVCANDAVTFDTLDIVDAMAIALQTAAATQNPAALSGAATSAQASLNQLASDLQGLINAASGSGGCGSNGQPSGSQIGGSNPLAGTPLAPLGSALAPVLAQIQSASAGGAPSLGSVAALVAQLNNAFASGVAQIPAPAASAPVVGAVLQTIKQALSDLSVTTNAASGGNSTATKAAMQTFLDHSLVNTLTQVVPLAMVENQGGHPGLLTTPINSGAAQVAQTLASGIGTVLTPVLQQNLSSGTSSLLNPLNGDVLQTLMSKIITAVSGAGSVPGIPTGTPLDGVIGALTHLLGPVGGAGNPVTSLLSQILGVVQGGGGTCPLAGTPLAVLCSVLP